jgi:hypothetical protein
MRLPSRRASGMTSIWRSIHPSEQQLLRWCDQPVHGRPLEHMCRAVRSAWPQRFFLPVGTPPPAPRLATSTAHDVRRGAGANRESNRRHMRRGG